MKPVNSQNPEQTEILLPQLEDAIQKESSSIYKDDLGEFAIPHDIRNKVQKILDITREGLEQGTRLPQAKVQVLRSTFRSLYDDIYALSTISRDDYARRENRTNYVTSINEKYDRILDIGIVIDFLKPKGQSLTDESETVKKLKDLITQATDAKNALQNASGSSAAHALGEFYENESFLNSANKQGSEYGHARNWLKAGFAFLTLFIISVIILGINPTTTLFNCNTGTSDELKISFIVERLLLLSAMAFVTRFTFRQYSIRMHASSSYKQKAVLAKTFERLLNTPRTQDRVDLIVTEVVSALSAFVPTGYIRKDEPELHPLSEITNLILSSKTKKER